MKSTNPIDQVKMKDVMDKLCTNRNMLYETEYGWKNIDARLVKEKDGKFCGFAKIVSSPGNFGSKPVVSVEKETVDFLYELSMLCGGYAALIVRFRDVVKYLRVQQTDQIPTINNLRRGKSYTTYEFPIIQFKDL